MLAGGDGLLDQCRGHTNYPVKWEGLHQLLRDVECGKVAKDFQKALVSITQHSANL